MKFRVVMVLITTVLVGGAGLVHRNSSLAQDLQQNDQNQSNRDHDHMEVLALTEKARHNIGIQTAKVAHRSIDRVVTTTGSIRAMPKRTATVTPRWNGIIKQVHLGLGDNVQKGQLLLELECLNLQISQIEFITALDRLQVLVQQRQALKAVSAQQIRLTLRQTQINYLQSLITLQQKEDAIQQTQQLVRARIGIELEKLTSAWLKADVSLSLAETELQRTQALVQEQISASQDLNQHQAVHSQAKNELAIIQHKFALFGIGEKQLEQIVTDQSQSIPIWQLLDLSSGWQQLVGLVEEGVQLIQVKSDREMAVAEVSANKQHLLNLGISPKLIESIQRNRTIETFEKMSDNQLLDNSSYLALLADPHQLIEIETAYHQAILANTEMKQKLIAWGLTDQQLEQISQTGEIITHFQVLAPISGQITQQSVAIGATVDKSTVLYSILNVNAVWVEGEAYQQRWLQLGKSVRVRVSAYPDQMFSGQIDQISVLQDSAKQTTHFRVALDNTNQQLRPGMFANLTVVLDRAEAVLAVPLQSVLEDGIGQFVFIQESVESQQTQHYTKHEVAVGQRDDQYVEISSGLSFDDTVVTQGNYQLLQALTQPTPPVDPHAGHSH